MKKVFFLITLILSFNSISAKTWYVNQSTSNTVQNGYYWATAIKNLRQAIDSSSAGDTIKVTEGSYIPGNSADAYFSIRSGTIVLGGYSALDSTKARNFSLYATSLNGRYSTTLFGRVKHVIRISGSSDNTLIDGFIIENGYSSSADLYVPDMGGGMIISTNGKPRIRNCVFRNNYARNGGAIAIIGNSSPEISNCIFINNSSEAGTVFMQNASGTRLINCIFTDNSVGLAGSALLLDQSNIAVTNSTFFRNKTLSPNTPTYNGAIFAVGGSILSLNNSILFANSVKESYEAMEIAAQGATINVSNCITQNYTEGSQTFWAQNPRFKDTADIAGPDKVFFTSDDGLQLMAPCSPGLNAGNNAAIISITTDIKGQPRIFNNGTVDIGAYELQNTLAVPMKVVYVNQTATGSNDGSSWTNAFTSLQQALLSCADTIKVAAGTYFPSTTNPASSFWLHSKLVILGGYPNTGNPSEAQRDPAKNISKLNGKIPGSATQSVNVLFVNGIDSTCIVDGLMISDANAFMQYTSKSATRISNKSNPIFINCRFESSTADFGGGMQVSGQSRPSFFNCRFANNRSFDGGGAFYTDNFSELYFKNCLFENNTVVESATIGGDGGAAIINGSSIIFDSCQFKNNSANNYGGAIYTTNQQPVVFRNCTFAGNFAKEAGNSIYNNGGKISCYKSFFSEPSITPIGGAVYNTNSSPFFEECVFKLCQSRTGGAIYNNASIPIFKKCVFTQNTAGRGGAIYNIDSRTVTMINCAATYNYSYEGSVLSNVRSSVEAISSTFAANNGSSPVVNTDSSVIKISNSILWANALGVKEFLAITFTDITNVTGATRPSSASLYNSVTQYYGTNGINNNIVGTSPRLVNFYDGDGPDDVFFTSDDGLRLSPCSPLINAGSNLYLPGVTTDLQGKPRINGTIDIGAYEFSEVVNTNNIVYVNASATGANNGSSWANAYIKLHDALDNICADTVKVAAGTYYASAKSIDSSFAVRYGRVILAGYPATGTPSDKDRNPWLQQTILSGNAGNQVDSLDNVNHVVSVKEADGKVVLDGFIIEGGYSRFGNGNSVVTDGAGLHTTGTDITIKNCIIRRNYSAISGGGIFIGSSGKFNIEKTVIINNRAALFGGGISIASSGKINSSAIVDNISDNKAGGMFTTARGIQISNTVFHHNFSMFSGGGAYHDNPRDVTYINCTFTRNSTSNYRGGGVYIQQDYDETYATFYNTIFHDNAQGSQANLIWTDVYFSRCTNTVDNCFFKYFSNCRLQSSWDYYNPVTGYPAFVDLDNNPEGKDGLWLTDDDGLRLTHCSPCIDRGRNDVVSNIPKDIINNDRIRYNSTDIGAYEYTQSLDGTAILQNPADSVVANREYTDSTGWTHYFRDCIYLLSIKKDNKNIGNIADNTLKIGMVTNANYGTSQALNLSNSTFNNSGAPLYAMNKYWYALSNYNITDSLQVRFPYTTKDFEDVKSAKQDIIKHEQLSFYQARNRSSAHDLTIPSTAITVYQSDTLASLYNFKTFAQDGYYISEFYINQFGSGSSFVTNNAPKADITITDIAIPVNTTKSADSVSISFREKNIGPGTAGYHTTMVYLSTDSALNTTGNADKIIGTYNISQFLQPGQQTDVLQKTIGIPCGTVSGTYYLIIAADNSNSIVETNETNNLYFKKLTIETGPSKPTGLTISSDHLGDIGCIGDSIKLSAQISPCVGCKFSWTSGDSTTSITVKQSGSYLVSVTNVCGQLAVSKRVTFKYPPSISPIANPTQICLGQSILLGDMLGIYADSIVWSGAGLNNYKGGSIQFTPPQSGNLVYTEKAYTKDRLCTTTKSVTVRVLSSQTPTLQISGNGCVTPYIFKVSSVTNVGQNARILWYKNDTLLSSRDTVISFNNLSRGASIYVKMLPQNPCANADTIQSNTILFDCSTTGIEDIPGINRFYIGPNPSTGTFTITLSTNMSKNISWIVYNSFGSKILESPATLWLGNVQKTIDLGKMPTGMYHLKLRVDKETFTYKLLVVR